ncbi:MAG: NERD domain-containing protein [Tissierellia bacterium]|nr:NERD domain-containing protein [Tissierellia bacterium]
MVIIILGLIILYILKISPSKTKYKDSAYKESSGNPFSQTVFNKGNYGEFLTFTELEKLSGYNILMTNLYIPKDNGSTTEIDVLMITETGIYVFESKNYSGWIFGDQKNKTWTQSLANKQKNRFYNPILQNYGHISALKSVLSIHDEEMYRSFIIFSERCELKNITITSDHVHVLKRNDLFHTVRRGMLESEKRMTYNEIDTIYQTLKKYTLVSEQVKKDHIKSISQRATDREITETQRVNTN